MTIENDSTVQASDEEMEATATDQGIHDPAWEEMDDSAFADLDLINQSSEELQEPEEEEETGQTVSEEEEEPEENQNQDDPFGDGDENEEESENEETSEEGFEEEADASESSEDDSESEENETDLLDSAKYKEAYEKIFAPFKANGHEIKVDNPDDVIRLMQMGANYNQKMATLKPGLKTLKLLERHNLMDESKLSLLIDASKGDKDAITKLIKDNQLDVYNLDLEGETDYKPKVQPISEKEYALSEVMDSLKIDPNYEKTLTVVTKEWDKDSRRIIVNEPHLIKTINQHIASGIYDIVQAEVVKQKALGNLEGVSDIVAYKQVGDALDGQGAFDHLAGTSPEKSEMRQPLAREAKPTKKSAINPKKKAVSPTKQRASATGKTNADFNPLEMSDEEFEKQFDPRLM